MSELSGRLTKDYDLEVFRLNARIASLEAALEFYAKAKPERVFVEGSEDSEYAKTCRTNSHSIQLKEDGGQIARAALTTPSPLGSVRKAQEAMKYTLAWANEKNAITESLAAAMSALSEAFGEVK